MGEEYDCVLPLSVPTGAGRGDWNDGRDSPGNDDEDDKDAEAESDEEEDPPDGENGADREFD